MSDGEELSFPLPASQARGIKAQGEVAPYGKGTETLHDDSVRKSWQIDASALRWNGPDWDKTIAGIVSAVTEDLGVEGEVVAEPYKLLLYEKGGFFLPHRDTEKLGAMFATLIVALPSAHKGGALVIRHGGQEVSVDFSGAEGRRQIQYAAFFADCEHEVQTVTSGRRLCLAYNLALKQGDPSSLNLALSDNASKLVPHFEVLRKTGGADLSAILLEHRYTEANLSLRNLKNHDRSRAEALLAAAAETGFTAHLALVTLHQLGELEDYHDWRGGGGAGGDGSMGEIFEESLTIDDWRTPKDRRVPLGSYSIENSRVISEHAVNDGDPDEQEEEGYTGNAGCTMDYWYRHAAIVVWPKEADADVLTRYHFAGACAQLADMASRKGAATNKKFLALGRAAMARAEEKLASAHEYGFLLATKEALPILDAVSASRSEELFARCRQSLLPQLLAVCDAKRWRKLFTAFGHDVGREFLAGGRELTSQRDALLSALAAMLGEKKVAENVAAPLAERLPDLLRPADDEQHHFVRDHANELTADQRLHIAIAASFLMRGKRKRKQLQDLALGGGLLQHLRKTLAPALKSKTHRRHFSHKDSLYGELLSAARERLAGEVAREFGPYPDWTRPWPEPEREPGGLYGYRRPLTELTTELKEFMADPVSESHRFTRREADRSVLESYIRTAGLDLDCRTEKKGSPYTLVCTKNDKSYARALKQRASDKKLLAQLEALS